MATTIDGAVFLAILFERFPNIVSDGDFARANLFMAMGALARGTQRAVSNEDIPAVKEYFEFIGSAYRRATPEVRNAIHVSYLEQISFDGRHGTRIKARELLPIQLQIALRGLEDYNAKLLGKQERR